MAEFLEIKTLSDGDLREALEAAIQACEAQLGIAITIHDLHGICRDAAGKPLLMRRNEHSHPLCRIERRNTIGRCRAHCVERVHAEATRLRRPFITGCWKGIREVVVPLVRGQHLIAVLYAGAWRSPRSNMQLDGVGQASEIRAEQVALPVLSDNQSRAIATQLELWGLGLFDWIERSRGGGPTGDDRRSLARRFIERHAHETLVLEDLASELHCSPSRTSHLVKELFGCSFRELLLRERIDRARVLLATSERPLALIAESCGFRNEYYFNRAFARRVGVPPGRWRATQRQRWNMG
jgi:AraC-like DNA-binding protein